MKENFKPMLFSTLMVQALLNGTKTQTRRLVKPQPIDYYLESSIKRNFNIEYLNPKIKKNDIIWVRETFLNEPIAHPDYKDCYFYKADNPYLFIGKWKPSLFMPKEACRLFLKVTDVRIERLQDINFVMYCKLYVPQNL